MAPLTNFPVGQGLMDSRDASLAQPGELSRADDCYYRPNNPAPAKIAPKAAANETAELPIYGARYLEFDGTTDQIVIGVREAYRKVGASTGTLTFSDLETGLIGGQTLDSVHYNNEHFLLNGVDRNRKVDSTATSSLHGMLPGDRAYTLSLIAAGGAITLSSGSTISYWLEEQVRNGDLVVKRNSVSTDEVTTWTGNGTAQIPYLGTTGDYFWVNDEATHLVLYASATNGVFPLGAQVNEFDRTSGSIQIADLRGPVSDPPLPDGAAYETVSVSVLGTSTLVPRNGPPPIATTGDVFNGHLVLNDITDRSKGWYSWPTEPQKFPSVYFIDINKGREVADEITCIRTVGDVQVWLARNSVWRINFFPIQGDAEFNTDRVKVQIEGAHGCVGPLAACTFSGLGGVRLAYISRYGLLITDGYTWAEASSDIAWESRINTAQLSKAFLVDNPRFFRLEMYYPSKGSNEVDKALYFHYHPSHIKGEDGFRLKVTGPVTISATCAFWGNIGGQDLRMLGASNGFLYTGDGDDPAMAVYTGDIYPNGLGNLAKLIRLTAHHPASANPDQEADLVCVSRREGFDDTMRRSNISLARREATGRTWPASAEAYQFGFENSDDLGECSINYFAAELEAGSRK